MAESRATILIVDDTPSNLDVLRAILGERYALKIATGGERALQIAAGDPRPDLVLLDIMMPGMDGYEVCRRLKADPATRAVPVIFVTAMDEIEDEAKGFAVGCVDYLVKPVSSPLVLARVATHLKLYQQERHLEALVRARTAEVEKNTAGTDQASRPCRRIQGRRDRSARDPHEPLRAPAGARQRDGTGARGGLVPRGPDARHRQDRHSRPHPAEARPAR
jgi:CheY-like chemotaxis protein